MTNLDAYNVFLQSRKPSANIAFSLIMNEGDKSPDCFQWIDITPILVGLVYHNQAGEPLAWIAIEHDTGMFFTRIYDTDFYDMCLGKVEAFIWNHYAKDEWK